MKNHMTTEECVQLGRDIADDLFRNGVNENADRLMLVEDLPGGSVRDMGGWCRDAVAMRIANHFAMRFGQPKREPRENAIVFDSIEVDARTIISVARKLRRKDAESVNHLKSLAGNIITRAKRLRQELSK